MKKYLALLMAVLVLAGCGGRVSRKGIMSQELPLTLDDLSEIKAGEENHERVLWEYRTFNSPKLQQYCNLIASDIAAVSTRPNLPYRVILLDADEVNIFGGPGGYIYLTRGLFDFVRSEGELAGLISHEITHVANFDYSNIPHATKIQKTYNIFKKGAEFAGENAGGPYGMAAKYGVRGVDKAAPSIARQFGRDNEVLADQKTVETLVAAGYDPREYQALVERLSRIKMEDVARFAVFMNTHPPFPDRRVVLANRIKGINFTDGKIEFKQDALAEVRASAVNTPQGNIMFEPQVDAPVVAAPAPSFDQEKKDEFGTYKKRWAWF